MKVYSLKHILAACFTATLIIFIAADSHAVRLEYPYIYKSPRSMGMGGVGVAVGGSFDSVFSNPAGLGDIKDDDWQVNIVNLGFAYSQKAIDFGDEMSDALDVGDVNGDGDTSDDETRAILEVISKYNGENMHMSTALVTSLARGGDIVSWGLGGFGALKMNFIPHQGLGSQGIIEADIIGDYGVIVGAALNGLDGLRPGLSLKFINRYSIRHALSLRELVEYQDTLDDYLEDNYKVEASALGIDAGVIYHLEGFLGDMNPSVALSIQDIGGTNFGEDAGEIPMTINLGFSVRPEFAIFNSVVFGVDYVDVTGQYEQDNDIVKRLRLGGEVVFADNAFAAFALRGGLYQGYGTFGADMRFTVLTLSYNTYAEEVGAYAGQQADRRHMLNFSIGW